MKITLCLLFLFTQFLSAQEADSTKAEQNLYPDSSKTKVELSASDTTGSPAKIDTLNPVYQQAFSTQSYFINRKEFTASDYRYAADIPEKFPFMFIKDYGFIGQPNEATIYGAGFGGISYFENGILINSRLTNSLDLNLVQTESIDSVEIIPSPRGFLYGPMNNPVSVNFLNRDFLSRPAYSRIKYYQGPSGEAMVDGFFNAWLYKKLDLSFDITNRKADSSYSNSSFRLWQARLKLKYLLSKKISVIGSFFYETSRAGLNGGVDVSQITGDIATTLYDNLLAPVVYIDRIEKTRQQYFTLKFLGKLTQNSESDLTIYYRSSFDGISAGSDTAYFANTGRESVSGLHLRHDIKEDIFKFTFLGNIEKATLNYDWLSYNSHPVSNYDFTNYSAAAVLSIDQGSGIFVPSVFVKVSHNSYYPADRNSRGFGVDAAINLPSDISFYAGYSLFENPGTSGTTRNFEVSSSFKNEFIYLDAKYFSRKGYERYSMPELTSSTAPATISNPTSFYQDMNGLGGQINFTLGKFLIENSGAHYFRSDKLYSVPKFTYRGGLFIKDSLFSGSLGLKAGLVFYYNGARNPAAAAPIVSSNSRLDFSLAGQIQGVAMIYFTWQNLFNSKYYIVPYYPMPPRGIRFGITWELYN